MVLNWRLRPLLRDKGGIQLGGEMRIQSSEIRSSEREDATFKAEREMQSGKDDRRPHSVSEMGGGTILA